MVTAVAALREWCAAKLAGPDDERLVQHSAGLEVAQQTGDRQVGGAGVVAVVFVKAAVGIPAVVAADARAGQLDEAHALLHQSPRHEALQAVRARVLVLVLEAVKPAGRRGLALDVDQLRHGGLHAVRHLVIGDRRLEFVNVAKPIEHAPVELGQQTQLGLLQAGPAFARPDVGQRLLAGLEHRRLVARRQEAVAKIIPAAGRHEAAVEHHEARQIRRQCA